MVIWKGQFASFEGLSSADKHCRGFVIKYVKVSSHSKNQPRTWNTLMYTNVSKSETFEATLMLGPSIVTYIQWWQPGPYTVRRVHLHDF